MLHASLLEQYSITQNKVPKRYASKVATSSGIVIPPEILTECLSNMGRSENIRMVSFSYIT